MAMDKSDSRNSKRSLRALVVDDSTVVRRLLEFTLGPMGMELDFAISGEEALGLVQASNYDVIFLDVLLPGIDGFQVCRSIKGDKRTRHTPVIILTSKDSAIDRVRGTMSGSNVYLTKPLEKSALLRAMEQCLPRTAVTLLKQATGR